jgi:hypothetical protein
VDLGKVDAEDRPQGGRALAKKVSVEKLQSRQNRPKQLDIGTKAVEVYLPIQIPAGRR